MGACKSCGEVVSALDMVDGFCPKCQDPEQREKVKTDNTLFWKHAFNWKYYIIFIILGLLFGYDYLMRGEVIQKGLNGVNLVGFISAIILTVNYKANIIKKIVMFFFGSFMMSIVFFSAYTLPTLFINEDQKIINNLLKQNEKLPMMLNKQSQLVKYSSPNNKTITMHIKMVNYTKNEILSDYSNNISQFEAEMLQDELKTSCPMKGIKNALSSGLDMNIEYLGKNNNIVGKITLNDERCKPYYQ